MKAVTFKLNTVLAAVAGALCLLAVLLRTFAPITVQLPNIDIPCLAAVSLIAIVVDCYLDWKKLTPHCWALTAVMAFLTFWLLPWAAGLVADAGAALRVGVIGGALFTVLAFLFATIRERLFSGKSNILAPLWGAVLVCRPCQGLAGMGLGEKKAPGRPASDRFNTSSGRRRDSSLRRLLFCTRREGRRTPAPPLLFCIISRIQLVHRILNEFSASFQLQVVL